MKVYAYHYNNEFIFDGLVECQFDPLNEGVFLIPAQSTPNPPPDKNGFLVPVYRPTQWVEKNGSHFIDGEWELICDYRSRLFWDKTTREVKRVTVLGGEPDPNWVDVEPGLYDVWNPGIKKWEKSAELEITAKKTELLQWNRVKFNVLKDIQFARENDLPLMVEELQSKLAEINRKISSYGDLK
jgi:hypothetical protein